MIKIHGVLNVRTPHIPGFRRLNAHRKVSGYKASRDMSMSHCHAFKDDKICGDSTGVSFDIDDKVRSMTAGGDGRDLHLGC